VADITCADWKPDAMAHIACAGRDGYAVADSTCSRGYADAVADLRAAAYGYAAALARVRGSGRRYALLHRTALWNNGGCAGQGEWPG